MAAISRGTIRLFTVYDTCSYPTLSKFSFAIQESTLSDKMYLIENVVSPHCGDKKKWRDVAWYIFFGLHFQHVVVLKGGKSISICYLKYGMCRDAIDMLRPQGNSLSLVGGKVWQCQIM